MDVRIEELEIADYDILENIKTALYRLWKFKMVVILMTLVGLLASVIFISIVGVKTTYRSSAAIYSLVYGSSDDSIDGVKVMNTYADLLGTTSVCERAAAYLQNPGITAVSLKSMVTGGRIYISGASTDSKKYGYRLTLVAMSTQPENITEIANAMAMAFVDEINELMGSNTLQVVDSAMGITSSKSISIPLIVALFGGVAFAMSCVVIFLKEFFSAKVYSVAQCEYRKEKILGMIPYQSK